MARELVDAIFTSAYAVANGLLMLESRITQEALDKAVETVGAMPTFAGLDLERLRKQLEADNNVHVGAYSVIDDKEFRAWIVAKREGREFFFWNRYKNYLEKHERIPREVVRQLDQLTDDILDRLRDPTTEGDWDRRGLVVGDVQSGKTANYTGVICKAVDSGFPLIIVLAGVHNSLRSQTQLRLDEGFLGFDTRLNLRFERENQRMGAGAMPSAPLLVAHSLTSSSETGDFRRTTAQGTKIVPGGHDPVILVVKKNVSVLTNLLHWVLSVRGVDEPKVPGGKIIRDVPVLIIDDEADFASANTNEYLDENGNIIEENDPTKTNRLIRQILSSFQKSAYVGYTATPFANVFMHHEAVAAGVGKDLFPSSFIINIPAPSNYIGPDRVFGADRSYSGAASDGLPIVRPVDDAEAIFPPKHKKELIVTSLPETLNNAILSFILACAARRARGDVTAHNSMLIHVTRFTLVQDQVARLLEETFTDIRRQLEFPGTGGDVEQRLDELWHDDFAANADQLRKMLSDHDLPEVSWNEVKSQLFDATKRIIVRKINGSAKDTLDYLEHPNGLSVIAVGGDKLSRGLTLYGLSVSYFVRASRMYDTLMQMGRWFGYRPRYADLCRLYTSKDLVNWYRYIAMATAELREEFDLMFARGATPLEFGNRVRTHPDGLLITAASKMRSGAKIRTGFSGTISETVSFDLDSAAHNFGVFDSFFRTLSKTPLDRGRYKWSGVNGKTIAALMDELDTSRDSWKANSKAIASYISNRTVSGRLKKWTVVLMASGNAEADPATIGGYKVKLTYRENRSEDSASKYTIGRLVSPVDEQLDLETKQVDAALAATIAAWEKKNEPKRIRPEKPSGPFIRAQRSVENGLLLVYPIDLGGTAKDPLIAFALSFPFDADAPLTEYAENSVKQLEDLFE